MKLTAASNKRGTNYSKILCDAVLLGNIHLVQKILNDNKDLIDFNWRNEYGVTPLFYAVLHRNIEIATLLINNGADVNYTDDNGTTILHLVAGDNNIEMAQLFLAHGANVNYQDNTLKSALYWAALFGKIEMTRLLINHGADVNMKYENGESALIIAVDYGSRAEKVIQLLIDAGAELNIDSRFT